MCLFSWLGRLGGLEGCAVKGLEVVVRCAVEERARKPVCWLAVCSGRDALMTCARVLWLLFFGRKQLAGTGVAGSLQYVSLPLSMLIIYIE